MPLSITIDTREQRPFHFPPTSAVVVRGTLRTGDYALTGDAGFAIERKSFDDFLGTISSGWDRFQREVARAREAGFVLPIVVEGWLDDCLWTDDGDKVMPPESMFNHPALSSKMILSRVAALWQLGACVIPCGSDLAAAAVTFALLLGRHKFLKEQEKEGFSDDRQKRIEDSRIGEAGALAERRDK